MLKIIKYLIKIKNIVTLEHYSKVEIKTSRNGLNKTNNLKT